MRKVSAMREGVVACGVRWGRCERTLLAASVSPSFTPYKQSFSPSLLLVASCSSREPTVSETGSVKATSLATRPNPTSPFPNGKKGKKKGRAGQGGAGVRACGEEGEGEGRRGRPRARRPSNMTATPQKNTRTPPHTQSKREKGGRRREYMIRTHDERPLAPFTALHMRTYKNHTRTHAHTKTMERVWKRVGEKGKGRGKDEGKKGAAGEEAAFSPCPWPFVYGGRRTGVTPATAALPTYSHVPVTPCACVCVTCVSKGVCCTARLDCFLDCPLALAPCLSRLLPVAPS